MKRSFWGRVTTLFVGLWFVAVAAGPELTHACPTHGAHATSAWAVSHDGHQAPAAPTAATAHHSDGDTNSSQSNQCTCLGQCRCTTPVALVTEMIALVEMASAATRDAGLPDYAYVPVAAQHVLPLAQAPPLSA